MFGIAFYIEATVHREPRLLFAIAEVALGLYLGLAV